MPPNIRRTPRMVDAKYKRLRSVIESHEDDSEEEDVPGEDSSKQDEEDDAGEDSAEHDDSQEEDDASKGSAEKDDDSKEEDLRDDSRDEEMRILEEINQPTCENRRSTVSTSDNLTVTSR